MQGAIVTNVDELKLIAADLRRRLDKLRIEYNMFPRNKSLMSPIKALRWGDLNQQLTLFVPLLRHLQAYIQCLDTENDNRQYVHARQYMYRVTKLHNFLANHARTQLLLPFPDVSSCFILQIPNSPYGFIMKRTLQEVWDTTLAEIEERAQKRHLAATKLIQSITKDQWKLVNDLGGTYVLNYHYKQPTK